MMPSDLGMALVLGIARGEDRSYWRFEGGGAVNSVSPVFKF